MVIYGAWEDEFNYIADDFSVQFKIQIFFCGYLRRIFRWPFDYRGFISSEEKYIFANIHYLSFGESSGRLDPIDDGNNTALLPIENMIHVIRGQQVMIDSDPA